MQPDAFAALYRTHVTMVRRRALRLLGNAGAAEDVAQQAFMQLIEYRREGGVDQNPAAFLYRTATNLALNLMRDAKRRTDLLAAHWVGGEATVESQGDRLAMRQTLTLVPEEEATIASLYHVDGLEQQEIADLLGIERRTVSRRLERFREHARALLQDPTGNTLVEEGKSSNADV